MPDIEMLTERQRAVLAHIVVDPDVWVAAANAAANVTDPQAALDAKVSRWAADYDAAVISEGENYKTRAQRDSQP